MSMFNLTHCPLKVDLDNDSVLLLQVLFRSYNSSVTKSMPLCIAKKYCEDLIVSQDDDPDIEDPWCSVINSDSLILNDISKCFGISLHFAYDLYSNFNNKLFSL